jgi:hypothetical protein
VGACACSPSRLARWTLRGPGGRRSPPHKPRPPGPSLIRSRGERHPAVSVPRGERIASSLRPLLTRGWARVRSGGYEVLRSEWRPRRNGRMTPRPPTSLSPTASEVRLGRSPSLSVPSGSSVGARGRTLAGGPGQDRLLEDRLLLRPRHGLLGERFVLLVEGLAGPWAPVPDALRNPIVRSTWVARR